MGGDRGSQVGGARRGHGGGGLIPSWALSQANVHVVNTVGEHVATSLGVTDLDRWSVN